MRHLLSPVRWPLHVLLSVIILLAACAQDDAVSENATREERKRETVTLLLSFLHSVNNNPYYLAEDLGYFDRCGIDIKFLPALEVENPLGVMLAGRVDYVVVDPLQAVTAIHQGLPVIPISEELARTPLSVVSLAKTGIESIADLPGHTVGVPSTGGGDEWFLKAAMEDSGLTPEEQERVRIVAVGFDIQPVLTGKVDAQTQFPTNPLFATLLLEGTEFNIFPFGDVGITTPGNVIVAPQEKVDDDPESVSRFMAAVEAGMEASLDPANAARAVELTQDYIGGEGVQDVLKTEVGLHLYDAIQEFRQEPLWDENGMGWNSAEGYAQAQDILIRFEQISEEDRLSPEDLYTNDILERVFDDNGEVRLDEVCS